MRCYLYPSEDASLRLLICAGINPLPHSTLTARRGAVLAAGGYRSLFDRIEDYELLIRLARIGRLRSIRQCLAEYTVRVGSYSATVREDGRSTRHSVLLAILVNTARRELRGEELQRLAEWLDTWDEGCLDGLRTLWAVHVLVGQRLAVGRAWAAQLVKLVFRSARSLLRLAATRRTVPTSPEQVLRLVLG